MDTSKTYIKMCDKAEEIQRGHKWQNGDYGDNSSIPIYCCHCYSEQGWNESQEDIWLPRQDQLQGMIGEFQDCINLLLRDGDYELWGRSISMEQLWLAFVMEGKYNKIWDGTDWVETNNENFTDSTHI